MADVSYSIRELSFAESSGILVLAVSGMLDTGNAAAFRAETNKLAASKDNLTALKLHLEGLSYVSSMGIGALVELMLELRKRKAALFLVNTPSQIKNVMDLLGFTKFMNLTTETKLNPR